jgi:hypothetical protein
MSNDENTLIGGSSPLARTSSESFRGCRADRLADLPRRSSAKAEVLQHRTKLDLSTIVPLCGTTVEALRGPPCGEALRGHDSSGS